MKRHRFLLAAVAAAAVTSLMSTATSVAAAPANSVGVVGGSITKLAVDGYHTLGGRAIWPSYQIGGGTIFAWQNDPTYFARFEQQLDRYPGTAAVWWQLAAHDRDLDAVTAEQAYATAVAVLDGIRQRTQPGTVVHASVMASYAPDTGCYLSGTVVNAPARLRTILIQLVDAGLVQRGPSMPTLQRNELQGDGCHQNDLGQRKHGQVLLDYFG
jgi:hypothetical protein